MVVGGQATLDSVRIATILKHKEDGSRLIFVGASSPSKTFMTTDGGDTYSIIADGLNLHDMKLHPIDPQLVLASTLSQGCIDATSNVNCYKALYVSKDFGFSWLLLGDFIVQFDWAYNLPYTHTRGMPLATILYTKQNSDTDSHQRFGVWDRRINMYRSEDLLKTNEQLVEGGNRFLITSKYLLVAQVQENNFHVRLLISKDGSRSFKEASLPFEMAEHSYSVLDTSDDVIFLHVNHWGEKARFGNVYVSNSHGLNYTLSLPHNVRNTRGLTDFEKVQGLHGIYVGNFQDNVDFDAAYEQELHNPDKPKVAKSNKELTEHKSMFPHIRTVITYDKGGEWSYLAAPKYDSIGKRIACEPKEGCGLNLFGATGVSGPFYSIESAVGILMATGSVGKWLTNDPAKANTYLSRDAGLTWSEVAKGNHIYEFGDHGGLIVMAEIGKTTDRVKYSYDEGKTWEKVQFTFEPITVDNIVTDPTGMSQKFIVYGSRDESGKSMGVIVHIDFAMLHTRTCTGSDDPDSPSSDYEVWTVHSDDKEESERCVLGKLVSYVRRKQESKCFNGEMFERPIFVKDCECTEKDWECDFNYKRDVNDKLGGCKEIFSVNQTAFIEEQCAVGDTYYIINGYRKVAGDTCSSGIDHTPAIHRCVHWSKSISVGGWTLLAIFLIMAVSLGFLSYLLVNRNKRKEMVFTYTAPTNYSQYLADAYEHLKGKLISLFVRRSDHSSSKIPLDSIHAFDGDNIGFENEDDQNAPATYRSPFGEFNPKY